MANNKKRYWTGLEELDNTEQFRQASENEFPAEQSVDEFLADSDLAQTSTGRRDFLKFLGFSLTAATVAACETPVIKSIPYINKPEQITPGVPNYYNSTYYDGHDYASVRIKTREGRPIHMMGNKAAGINNGAITPRVNASVLMLYDSSRLRNPMIDGKEVQWSDIDNQVTNDLATATSQGKIVLLSNTIISPSTQKVISDFKSLYGGEDGSGFEHITYDALSHSGIRKANEISFGKSMIPSYDFTKAKVIVGIAADFLANWVMPTVFIPQYTQRRDPDGEWMSKHYHFEGNMSLTGTNADKRFPVKASQEGQVALAIYNALAKKSAKPTLSGSTDGLDSKAIEMVVDDLWKNIGSSLVVAGSNDPNVQLIVNGINELLGNYGNTIDLNKEIFLKQGDEAKTQQLIKDMAAGKVGAIMLYGVNPAYSLPNADEFVAALKKVPTSISFSLYQDETASLCKYITPDHHYMEAWNDFYPMTGHYALAQPVITNLYNTRQAQESILAWSGNSTDFLSYIKGVWQAEAASHMSEGDAFSFRDFWNNALRMGSYDLPQNAGEMVGSQPAFAAELQPAANAVVSTAKSAGDDYEVIFYPKVAIGDGGHANNPWLQELPDPMTRVTWDNYITMNPAEVKKLGLNVYLNQENFASVVELTLDGKTLELPVYAMPGQKRGTIGIALGYGRGANNEKIGHAAFRTKKYGGYQTDENGKRIPIGKNAYPMVKLSGDGHYQYIAFGGKIKPLEKEFPLALTQTHSTIMGRDSILKETTLGIYKSDPKEKYNPSHEIVVNKDGEPTEKSTRKINLWQEFPVNGVGHHWGMSIDLSKCIGCGACATACQSENNVAVVGKDEVRRSREMHWIRIDRYFSSDVTTQEQAFEEGMSRAETYHAMDVPEYDTPQTVYMPMMCQHCNHAPCETVCPVAATTHSEEGLNMMTYNRCIGTRYCANNCPYKVRRFNWFNYKAYEKFTQVNPSQDRMMRLVLNPDVTVRARGVMEKCSMCVQRIQYGKLDAELASHPVKDGAIETACADACPTHAIIFGDYNDENSQVAHKVVEDRSYFALEEIGTRPSVHYQLKVRNNETEEA